SEKIEPQRHRDTEKTNASEARITRIIENSRAISTRSFPILIRVIRGSYLSSLCLCASVVQFFGRSKSNSPADAGGSPIPFSVHPRRNLPAPAEFRALSRANFDSAPLTAPLSMAYRCVNPMGHPVP